MIEVWFDGACEPRNPGGHCGYGAVICKDGPRIHEISAFIPQSPENSNNLAEYMALWSALRWLLGEGYAKDRIVVRGDSQLVIKQMWGRWKIKAGRYVQVAEHCKAMLTEFSSLSGSWIPREENHLADELSKRELKRRGVQFRLQVEVEAQPTMDEEFRAAMAREA